jgi:hypothetical protein
MTQGDGMKIGHMAQVTMPRMTDNLPIHTHHHHHNKLQKKLIFWWCLFCVQHRHTHRREKSVDQYQQCGEKDAERQQHAIPDLMKTTKVSSVTR